MTATFADRFTDAFRNILPLQGPFPLTSERLLDYIGGPPSVTGARVSVDSVLGIPAAYACVRVLAETVASLPLFTFERLERGRRRAGEHPTFRLLADTPNDWMTSFQLREMLMGHLALRGNAFCEIDLDGRGQPRALWPLRPDRMERPELSQAGSLIYPYTLPSGERVELPQRRVLHIRALSDDGLWGYSPVTLEREAFGHALATQEYASRFFGSGAKPGGVLQAKGKLTKDGAERMASSWRAAHEGLSMAHRIAVLEEGVEWKAVGMTNEDAQFLETRSFSVSEIARIFRIPPHMIGDVERSTSWGTGIEQQTIGFVQFTLMPWLVRWEQQIHRDLFLEAERARFYPKFMVNGLLRGDSAARAQLYSVLFDRATITPNDMLELEDMELISEPSGDWRFYQRNMAIVGTEPAAPPALS